MWGGGVGMRCGVWGGGVVCGEEVCGMGRRCGVGRRCVVWGGGEWCGEVSGMGRRCVVWECYGEVNGLGRTLMWGGGECDVEG